MTTAPATPEAAQWEGWKSHLKPAYEPVLLFRKPLDGTIAETVLKWGTGGLNIDDCRIFGDMGSDRSLGKPRRTDNTKYGKANEQINPQPPQGRYPSNLIVSSDPQVEKCFPVTGPSSGVRSGGHHACHEGYQRPNKSMFQDKNDWVGVSDNGGSASRFFQHCDYSIEEIAEMHGIEARRIVYSGKASKRDRDEGCEGMEEKRSDYRPNESAEGYGGNGLSARIHNSVPRHNHHATVKPLSLLRYLLKLITPPGATVIDPFFGSGSTGKAALLEGFRVIGIEREQDYFEISKARCAHVSPETFAMNLTPAVIKPIQPPCGDLFDAA